MPEQQELLNALNVLENHKDWDLAANIYSHLLRGETSLESSQKYELAKRWLRASQKAEHQDVAIGTLLRYAAPLGKHRETVMLLEAWLPRIKQSAELFAAMSTLSLQSGDMIKARAYVDAALELDPRHRSALRLFELLRSS